MPIDEFLKYPTPLDKESRQDARDSFNNGIGWDDIPNLKIDDTDINNVRVTGHEGRHRALVLKEAGYVTMPVEIRSTLIRWSEQSNPQESDYTEYIPTQVLSEDGKRMLPYPADRNSYQNQQAVFNRLSSPQVVGGGILPAPSASRFGSISGIPNVVAADTTDYSGFTELFTFPAFEVGTYKSPTSTFAQAFWGSFDGRIKRHLNIQKSLERAGLDMMTRFKKRLDLIIKREFNGDPSSVVDLINRASGTTRNTFTDDAWNAINDKYDTQLEEVGTAARPYDPAELNDMVAAMTMENPTLPPRIIEKMAKRELFQLESSRIEATRNAEIESERKRINDEIRLDRDAAFMEIRSLSPNLAKAVADLRQIIDEISSKAAKETGIRNPALSVIIDQNLGIYVTRAYQFFEDAGYADAVSTPDVPPEHAGVVDAADDYFRNEWIRNQVKLLRKQNPNLTESQAEADAEVNYRTASTRFGISPAIAARIEFLSRYRPGGASTSMSGNPDVIEVVDASLKRRKDIPQVLRDLLGERTGDDGIYNLIRTLGVVTRITASQGMVNSIRNIATTGPDKWVYGPDEVGSGSDQITPGALRAKGYRAISGKLGGSPFSGLQGYYAPNEFVDSIEATAAEASRRFAAAASEKVMEQILGWSKYLTGLTMGWKTLWSIAHYPRNILGQGMAAINQGRPGLLLTSFKPLARELGRVGLRTIGKDISDEAFARRLKLVGLGVADDNVRTNTFRQLVSGQRSLDDVESEMRMLFDQATVDKVKGVVSWLPARLAELEGATEDFMKIAVYNDTLSVLERARESGEGSFKGVKFADMTDNDLERIAADMTQETMPSYSRTTPIIRGFTKSNAGDLVAPFIRYYSEQIRIGVRSPVLAFQEMRSGNPVMVMRGVQRMIGTVTAQALGVFGAAAVTNLFSGVDDEEEETVVETEPPYLRNHALAYYDYNGVTYRLDLSFLNSMSVWGDPFKAAYNKASKGDIYGGISALIKTSLEDTLLNPQILYGAVKSALDNKDVTTGRSIYIEGVDTDGEAAYKQISYIFKKIAPSAALTMLRIYDAETAPGGTEDEYSTEYALIQQLAPARPVPVDMERRLRTFMQGKKRQLEEVYSAQYVLSGRDPISEAKVRKVYNEQVEDVRGILSQIYKHGRNFASLGVSNEVIYEEISNTIGKEKTDLLYSGFMRKPKLPEGLEESLNRPERKGNYGPQRIQYWREEEAKYQEFMSIK
jgi:hypothetical protein